MDLALFARCPRRIFPTSLTGDVASEIAEDDWERGCVFGCVSSPSCASFALRRTATDNQDQFDEETVETVRKNFYVDDCLKSVQSEQDAVRLAGQLRDLLAKGGFRLTKWLSNSRRVIESVPVSERAGSVKNLDLDHLPVEHALGVQWDVQSDVFRFKIAAKHSTWTQKI